MLVFELFSDDAALLGPHRTRGGWEICEATGSEKEGGAGRLWLRCPDGEAAEEVITGLPCAARYRFGGPGATAVETAARGGLVPLGKTLPVGRMPAGPWVKLADWLKVEGPQAVLPGRCQDRMTVELARSGWEEPATALLLTLESLTAWAESSSRLRMARLRFAVSSSTSASAGKMESRPQALVMGEPPPAAHGRACYSRGRMLLPCGWDFAPPLRAEWVAESLALPPGAVALFDSQGAVELLEQESFAPLSLSAVRRTGRALGLAFP